MILVSTIYTESISLTRIVNIFQFFHLSCHNNNIVLVIYIGSQTVKMIDIPSIG